MVIERSYTDFIALYLYLQQLLYNKTEHKTNKPNNKRHKGAVKVNNKGEANDTKIKGSHDFTLDLKEEVQIFVLKRVNMK